MKTAPIMAAMGEQSSRFQQVLVHTGQHYDYNMSDVFFTELGLPAPDEFLGVGSGTHAAQTARTMLAFEPVLEKHQPDWVMVVGDVNSTLACALVAAKRGVSVAHVEAGLRSGDRSMPEETNRMLTDQLADLLFTPSRDCWTNLLREGVEPHRIHFVGNVMIDTLIALLPTAMRCGMPARLGLQDGTYGLVTLHRPGNVDDPHTLREILSGISRVADSVPMVFPIHPRTRQRIEQLGQPSHTDRLRLIEPLGYLEFLSLMASSRLVITDSGGVQEETTYLGVPCLTVRPNTERPVTIEVGTNRLVEGAAEPIAQAVQEGLHGTPTSASKPEYWDGLAARRIVQALLDIDAPTRGLCRPPRSGGSVLPSGSPVTVA
jgi:UDP-N-acetylglucosamine 2-epimerase (non-hydrolysing)